MVDYKSYAEQKDLHTPAPYRASMLTYPSNFRQAFKDAQADPSKTLMDIGHGIPGTFVTKLIASIKRDFTWIDAEHGMFKRLELHEYVGKVEWRLFIEKVYTNMYVLSAIHAAQHDSEGKSLVIVRVPQHDELSVSTALDASASGIIIPHTESAEDVRNFMKNAYFGTHPSLPLSTTHIRI